MSMTIGDRIMAVRRLIPDMPASVLPAPTVTVDPLGDTGGFLPAGVYYLVLTQLNPYGESLPTQEFTVTLTDPGNVIGASVFPSPGATAIRWYLTIPNGGSGNEILVSDSAVFTNSASQAIIVGQTEYPQAAGTPPTRSTAWLPGTDGKTFAVTTMYQWLNSALNKLSHAVMGIQDYCGVPTLAGQPLYTVPGQWLTISDVWYGGYWIKGGQRQWFYRRNAVTTNVLSGVTISVQSDKQVMEVTYQPSRSAGTTTTTASMTATDTSVAITDPSFALLPFGFAMIGAEIVAYSSLANGVMSGLIRGLGSTTAQAWGSGTGVTELSLFWCGKRIFSQAYSPVTDSVNTVIPVPFGWGPIIDMYMLSQAKLAEQSVQEGQGLEQAALAEALRLTAANRGVNQFVQVGGANSPETFDNSVAGGVIVP